MKSEIDLYRIENKDVTYQQDLLKSETKIQVVTKECNHVHVNEPGIRFKLVHSDFGELEIYNWRLGLYMVHFKLNNAYAQQIFSEMEQRFPQDYRTFSQDRYRKLIARIGNTREEYAVDLEENPFARGPMRHGCYDISYLLNLSNGKKRREEEFKLFTFMLIKRKNEKN